MSKQRIHFAAQQGVLKALQEELDKGVSIDSADSDGYTPLHYAAICGQLEAVKFLIERKATVDKVARVGLTALHRTCANNYSEIAAFLLDKGADINKGDNDGQTPLMRAVVGGASKCVRLLLERKADLSLKATEGNLKGDTALDIAKGRRQLYEIVSMLEFASATASPPPALPAPRVELAPTAGPSSVADKADSKSSAAESNTKQT